MSLHPLAEAIHRGFAPMVGRVLARRRVRPNAFAFAKGGHLQAEALQAANNVF